jgi:hypothetical protein
MRVASLYVGGAFPFCGWAPCSEYVGGVFETMEALRRCNGPAGALR